MQLLSLKSLKVLMTCIIGVAFIALCFEFRLALNQGAIVKKHLSAFKITEKRMDVAPRLECKLSKNGRWFQVCGLQVDKTTPIGTWPNARTIGFMELDGWPIHQTDRYGFFNKDEWWDDNPTILIIGDSYVTCEHIRSESSITSQIRSLGVKAINLGVCGSGPHLQLNALVAYWSKLSNSVQTIVWMYYEGNDLQDIVEEKDSWNNVHKQSWNPVPDQSKLANLPEDDWKLYGTGYLVKSIMSLSRSRREMSCWVRNPSERKEHQKLLDRASSFGVRLILVRIRRPGWNLDAYWNSLKCAEKLDTMPSTNLWNGGIVTGHYTKTAYSNLAAKLLSIKTTN